MAKMGVGQNVREFIAIVFLLLGALFGMIIMSFIFTSLSPGATGIEDDTITLENVTGAYINETLYTIPEASNSNFNGGFTVIEVVNASNNVVLTSGNYTVDSVAGTIVNASNDTSPEVYLNYSYLQKTQAREQSEQIQNNSLQAIVNYSDQAGTQFSTVGIAITLLVLIALFVVFWKIFVASKKGKGKSGSGGNFS